MKTYRTALLLFSLGAQLGFAAGLSGPSGSATTGPGAGGGGILVNDVGVNASESFLEAILTNVENMVAITGDITGGKNGQNDEVKEIEKALGGSTAGIKVEELKYKPDAITLIERRRLTEELKSRKDAKSYAAYIAYLEALQVNESRMVVYGERLNTLIKVNNQRLNMTERIKLASELELLGGQQSLADQEMREVANRMKIAGSAKRLSDAEAAAARRKANEEISSALASP